MMNKNILKTMSFLLILTFCVVEVGYGGYLDRNILKSKNLAANNNFQKQEILMKEVVLKTFSKKSLIAEYSERPELRSFKEIFFSTSAMLIYGLFGFIIPLFLDAFIVDSLRPLETWYGLVIPFWVKYHLNDFFIAVYLTGLLYLTSRLIMWQAKFYFRYLLRKNRTGSFLNIKLRKLQYSFKTDIIHTLLIFFIAVGFAFWWEILVQGFQLTSLPQYLSELIPALKGDSLIDPLFLIDFLFELVGIIMITLIRIRLDIHRHFTDFKLKIVSKKTNPQRVVPTHDVNQNILKDPAQMNIINTIFFRAA